MNDDSRRAEKNDHIKKKTAIVAWLTVKTENPCNYTSSNSFWNTQETDSCEDQILN